LFSALCAADLDCGGVDHVEAVGGFEAGNEFARERLHAGAVALAAGEVEVEPTAQYAFGEAREAAERILDAAAEELSARS
jgi:hypothetical protein